MYIVFSVASCWKNQKVMSALCEQALFFATGDGRVIVVARTVLACRFKKGVTYVCLVAAREGGGTRVMGLVRDTGTSSLVSGIAHNFGVVVRSPFTFWFL